MKKYFLYAVILFLGLTSFTAQSVWGQETDYSSKYWARASAVMDKDPENTGREFFGLPEDVCEDFWKKCLTRYLGFPLDRQNDPSAQKVIRSQLDKYMKEQFKDEPNIWYSAGLLCCDPSVVHHIFNEIEEKERIKRERGY